MINRFKAFQILIITTAALALVGCQQDSSAAKPQPSTATMILTTPTEEPFYAPDFTLQTLDGNSITLSELRGRWVLINFWATWCEPCIAEMPVLQAVADRYLADMTVLGINMRETPELISEFLAPLDIHYPMLINPDGATLMNYQVVQLPQTLIVDPNGEIMWRQFGKLEIESIENEIDHLISEQQ